MASSRSRGYAAYWRFHSIVRNLPFFSRRLVLLSLCSVLSGCATFTPAPKTSAAAAITTGAYVLDSDHAALIVRISHFGVSDYMGRFNSIRGVLDIDENAPESAQFSFTVETASLDVNNSEFEETLRGKNWLNSGEFPQAVFNMDSLKRTGENTARIAGTLTLRGITKPLILDAELIGGAQNPLTRKYSLGFKASGVFKRSEFGIDKYLSFAGDKFDFDTVNLEFNGEFIKN